MKTKKPKRSWKLYMLLNESENIIRLMHEEPDMDHVKQYGYKLIKVTVTEGWEK